MKKLIRNILILGAFLTFVAGAVAFGVKEQRTEPMDSPSPYWFHKGLYVGPKSVNPPSDTTNKITRVLSTSATIDFAVSPDPTGVDGPIDSSGITLTGAKAGDVCIVGPPAAITANAGFTCYVSAADTVKVRFTAAARNTTTCTLNGASPSVCTATVLASSACTCTNVGATAAIAAAGCAVGLSGTTLTVTSANAASNVVNIQCRAPVDPASATYYVRVISSQ